MNNEVLFPYYNEINRLWALAEKRIKSTGCNIEVVYNYGTGSDVKRLLWGKCAGKWCICTKTLDELSPVVTQSIERRIMLIGHYPGLYDLVVHTMEERPKHIQAAIDKFRKILDEPG